MTTRFISDLHFYHAEVINYENRPFNNIIHMNDELIRRWNSVVKRNDETWVIGDFAFNKHPDVLKSIMEELNGIKHLVLGNHDERFRAWTWMKIGFSSVHTIAKIYLEETNDEIYLAHKPDARHQWMLPQHCTLMHGHVHGRLGYKTNFNGNAWDICACCELWDYTPFRFEDLLF